MISPLAPEIISLAAFKTVPATFPTVCAKDELSFAFVDGIYEWQAGKGILIAYARLSFSFFCPYTIVGAFVIVSSDDHKQITVSSELAVYTLDKVVYMVSKTELYAAYWKYSFDWYLGSLHKGCAILMVLPLNA